MNLLSFAKGALAMFWLVALLNVFYPFAAPLGGWVNWAALAVLLAHVGELVLFGSRLRGLPLLWWQRLQVLLFGVLHLQTLR
jgi:putative membrane protein